MVILMYKLCGGGVGIFKRYNHTYNFLGEGLLCVINV